MDKSICTNGKLAVMYIHGSKALDIDNRYAFRLL